MRLEENTAQAQLGSRLSLQKGVLSPKLAICWVPPDNVSLLIILISTLLILMLQSQYFSLGTQPLMNNGYWLSWSGLELVLHWVPLRAPR